MSGMMAADGSYNVTVVGGGGSGGGAATIADGADKAEGTTTDVAYTTGAGTVVAILKGIFSKLAGTLAVSGTFFQATQPVSAASLPLPTNAAQETGGNLAVIAGSITSAVGQENVKQINGVVPLMGNGVTGTGSQRVTIASDNIAVAAAGQGARAATAPANATQIGIRGATANPTAVTDGQMVGVMADKLGKQIAVDAIRTLKLSQKTTLSNTTAETTIVTAGAASIFNDPFAMIFANSGASSTKVDIRDVAAGTIIATFFVPAGETRGWANPAGSGYSQTTAASAWTAQCSVATTALEVTVQYVVNL